MFLLTGRRLPRSSLFPYTTLFRSEPPEQPRRIVVYDQQLAVFRPHEAFADGVIEKCEQWIEVDRKSTRLNSSHMSISYAVFCLIKKSGTIKSKYENQQPHTSGGGT